MAASYYLRELMLYSARRIMAPERSSHITSARTVGRIRRVRGSGIFRLHVSRKAQRVLPIYTRVNLARWIYLVVQAERTTVRRRYLPASISELMTLAESPGERSPLRMKLRMLLHPPIMVRFLRPEKLTMPPTTQAAVASGRIQEVR